MSLQFPPQAAWLFAALTGEVPPNGDEDKLFALAEAHHDLHGKLTGDIQQQVAEAMGLTAKNFGGDASVAYQEAMKGFLGGQKGLDYFNAVSDQAQLLGDFTRESATQLQYTKYMIIAQLVELLVEAAVAAAMAFFFGVSIQAYLARQAIARLLIRNWLTRLLSTLLMHEIINVGLGVAMDVLVQWTQLNQGTRDSFDTDLTKGAALSGAVQGALAGPFHALGNKFGKGLANLFGMDGGKNLGKKLDDVFPPPKGAGTKGPGPKAVGANPPKSFGDDMANVFKEHLPKTAGPNPKQAADDFAHAVGDTFQKHLGGKEAKDVGQNWAKTLLEKTGQKDLPDALAQSLKPLGKQLDEPVADVLSKGTADVLGKNIVKSLLHGANEGVFEGVHAAVSEGTYNLAFTDEHQFKTSGLTFGSGMVEGRVGHFMESGGDKLGAALADKVNQMSSPFGPPEGLDTGGGTGKGDGEGAVASATTNASAAPPTAVTTNTTTVPTASTVVPTDLSAAGSGLDGLAEPTTTSDVPVTTESTGGEDSSYREGAKSSENAEITGSTEADEESGAAGQETANGNQPVAGVVQPPAQQVTAPPNTAAASNQTTPASGQAGQSGQNSSSNARAGNTATNTGSGANTNTTTNVGTDSVTPPVQNVTTETDSSLEPGSGRQLDPSQSQSPSQQQLNTESGDQSHLRPEGQEGTLPHEDGEDRTRTGIRTASQAPYIESQLSSSTESSLTTPVVVSESQVTDPLTRLAAHDGSTGEDLVTSKAPPTTDGADHESNTTTDDNTPGPGDRTTPPLAQQQHDHTSLTLTQTETSTSPLPPPPPPPPPPPNRSTPLSSEVTKFGTAGSEGIGGVQLSPIHDDVAAGLRRQVLEELAVPPAHQDDVRAQLATLLSAQALHDNRLMLLSPDGHRVTVLVDGGPRHVDVRLDLSAPRPSAVFGGGNRKPPHNNEQRQAAAFDTSSQAGTTAVRTLSVPYSNTLSKIWKHLTGIPVSASLSGTHQQRSLTTTVSGVVNSTSLLRSSEPASPIDYRAAWSVRQSPSPDALTGQAWSPAQERGTMTVWFPEHLTRPDSDADGPAHVISRDKDEFDSHLDKLPLWAMDSMSDPGSLLRQAREQYRTEFQQLAPESLATAEKFFGGEHLLGALPLQRRPNERDTRTPGTLSPVLLDKSGNAYGVFRVVADVAPREGNGLRDIRVGEKYNFERYLDRQLKVDSLSKVSSSLGFDGSVGAALNKEPAEAVKAFRDFHPGGSVAPKGGYGFQKDKGFGAGATHNVVHNLRSNAGHLLTPAAVTYHVEFIPADGTRSTPWSARPTDVRIRTLAPDTVDGKPPAEEVKLPPELDRLDSIGVTTTPLRIHGDGVTRVLDAAGKWLQDEGFLPVPGQNSPFSDESLVKARLENLRRFTLLSSPNGLLGTVDELVDGGLLLHFSRPEKGGGVRRVQFRLALDRDSAQDAATHTTSLSGVYMPSSSALSVPGTSQQASSSTKSFSVSGEFTGLAAGHLRASFTGDYKGTWQTTETSSVSASLSHTQLMLTSNQTTEVFQVPAALTLDVFEGTDREPVFSWDSRVHAPVDGDPGPVHLDLAVPKGRTLSATDGATGAPVVYGPAVLNPPGAVTPQEQQNTFRLPDSSLVDVMRGSGKLYEAIDEMLRGLSEQTRRQPGVTEHVPTPDRPDPLRSMPGAFPDSGGSQDVEPGVLPTHVASDTASVRTTTAPSTWWTSAANTAKTVTDAVQAVADAAQTAASYVLNAASVVQHTLTGTDRADHGLLLSEAIHAQLSPAALLSRAHQMTKGRYVIDDLFVPGALAGTDLVVEVRAVVSDARSLGEVKQYGETDLGITDAASHQVTKGSSHEGGPGLSLKSGASKEEVEAARAAPADTAGQAPVTGGAGVKGVWGRGSSRSVTSSATTAMTRVPTESGTQHRITADITYEVTIRRGIRGVAPVNFRADAVTRTVSVPGGIQFLATPDQLRRSGNATLMDLAGPVDESRPQNVPLPYRFRKHGLLGLAAVLDVTPLDGPVRAPVPPAADGRETATDESRTRNEQTREPVPDHDLFRDRLTALVEQHAPGSLTPGSAGYVPGLRQRIADYTSPAALGSLPGRGSGNPLTFTFPYAGGATTREVAIRIKSELAWNSQQLEHVRGRRAGQGAALENFTQHAPNNVTESSSRTTRWGLSVPGSVNVPTNGSRKAALGPGFAHSTTRTDSVSTTFTAEDRVWQRTEGGDEFALAYRFSADLTIGGETHPVSAPVDARVTLRFAGDREQHETPGEPLADAVHTDDPTRNLERLSHATPLKPTGNEVVYGLTNQKELLTAVREVAPALADDGLTTGVTDEGAAVRLTELLHGGKLTVDPVRAAAGLGGGLAGAGKHPQVIMTTKVFNPRMVDDTAGVTVDRVRAVGFSTSASSSTSRSTAFTLSVSGTLLSDGSHNLGMSLPVNQYQSTPRGQGGGISAAGRRWEKTGTAGLPEAESGLRTYEVEVDTVTTVTGPDGTVRHVTGTAVMRVPERDLLGLGFFTTADRGNGVWDLSAARDVPATALTGQITAAGPLPAGNAPQLWLDLGTDPTPRARMDALRRASDLARTGGLTVELALRDGDGVRFWTFGPDGRQITPNGETLAGADLFVRQAGAQAALVRADQELSLFNSLHDMGTNDPQTLLTRSEERHRLDERAVGAATDALAEHHTRLTELATEEAETRQYLNDLTRQLGRIDDRLSGHPAPHPDTARRLTTQAEVLRNEIRAQETELGRLTKERADTEARRPGLDKDLRQAETDVRTSESELRRARRWADLHQNVDTAVRNLADVNARITTVAQQLAAAHGTSTHAAPPPRPTADFQVPPPTDPLAQSLASQPVPWPAPKAPEHGPGPVPTSSRDTPAQTGPQHVAPPRPAGKRVAHPVLPHELNGFAGTSTKAVHTERFDPQVLQTGKVPGRLTGSMTLIRYHVRRERLPDGRTVRHFVVTLPVSLADGLAPRELAGLRTRVQSTLDAHVNTGYELPGSGDQLRVTVEFVDAPGHSEAVTLFDAPVPGRADQLHWDVKHSDAVLTHEVLHYLGLADEYSDATAANPHLFRRNRNASGVRPDGVMTHADENSLSTMPEEYLSTIERVSMNAVIPLHTAGTAPLTVPGAAWRLAPSDDGGAPVPRTSRAPEHWNRPLSEYVRAYGGQGFTGVGMEHFDPLSTTQLNALADQVAAALTDRGRALSADEVAKVRTAVDTRFGSAALNALMPYVLSEHGYALTVGLDDGPQTVDVRLTLSDPATSTRFGGHTVEDPQRRIEKRATSALESGSASGSVNARSLPVPFTGKLSAGAGSVYKGALFSPTLNITHNQRAFSSTTADTVAQTQVMRNNTPSHPVDFTTHWRVRVRERAGNDTMPGTFSQDPEQNAGVPLQEGWGPVSSHGKLTVQFPDRVATVPESGAPENGADHTGNTGRTVTDEALGRLPLWGVDSVRDPGAPLRAAMADPRFRGLFDSLSEQSRKEVLTLLGETNLRGGLPLQRVGPDGGGGQYTPLLYTAGGQVVGMLKLEALLTPVEAAPLTRVPGDFFLESHLTRTMKLDTAVKISSGLGVDVALNVSADLAAGLFGKAADWVLGIGGGPKGGWKRNWTVGHNSGGTTTVNHTLRTTREHHVVPFTAGYTLQMIGRDGTGPSFDLGSTGLALRIPPVPAAPADTAGTRRPAPELAGLKAIGVSATPLRIEGTERMFDAAERWLRKEGFLPPVRTEATGLAGLYERAGALMRDRLDESTVAARLANLRLFEQMRSQLGLRGAVDDIVGGAHRAWLTLPGGLTRAERRIELSLSAFGRAGDITHDDSLADVETINSVALALPGTEQRAMTGTWAGGGGVSLSGPSGTSPLSASGGYTYTYNAQSGTTSTDGNGLGHDQLVLTRNKPTEVFSIPADFTLTITDGSGRRPVPPFTTVAPADSTVIRIDREPTPVPPRIVLAVPHDRTVSADSTPVEQPPARIREVTTTGTRTDAVPLAFRATWDDGTPTDVLRLPDDAFIDLAQGAELLRKALVDGFRQILDTGTDGDRNTGAASNTNTGVTDRNRLTRALIGAEPNNHATPLAEQLHTAVNAAQLAAHGHQILKGGYVVEGLVLPGMALDTEFSVEIQAYATKPVLLTGAAGHAQYIETGTSGSASHAFQQSTGTSHDHAGTATLKPVSWFQPPVGYTYSSREDRNETRTASSNVTRTPAESMTLLRMGADTTFVVTIRRGHRNLFLNAAPQRLQSAVNLGPSVFTFAVDVPGGLQFLTTPGQLRRNRQFFANVDGLTVPQDPQPTVEFPQTLRDGRAFGIGSVLNAVPLAPPENVSTPPENATAPPENVPDTERNRFRDTITALVEKVAPGLLTPGDSFSPGALARISDLTSTAGMRMLPARGPGNPLRVRFVHVRNGIARLVEISLHAAPTGDLGDVRGFVADTGSGQENTFTHVPGNTQVSDVITKKHAVTASSGTRYPRPPVGQHADTLALQLAHSSGRAVTTTSAVSSDQRFWLRTDNAAEFRVVYEYRVEARTKVLPLAPLQLTQDVLRGPLFTDSRWAQWLDGTLGGLSEYGPVHVPEDPPARVQVDLRLTGSDVHAASDRGPGAGPERKLLRNGRVVVHRFTGAEELRNAVHEVAPSLGLGTVMPSGNTAPGSEAGDLAAVQFTELVQHDAVEFDTLRLADLLGVVPSRASDDRVTFSVDLRRPLSLSHTGSMAVDRVHIQATSATSSAVQSDSTALNLQVKYDLDEEQTVTLGSTLPLVQGQPQRPAAGGSHTTTDRSWQRQGVTSEPENERRWQTHLVTVETVITVQGPQGTRTVTGTAVVRLPERDLLGLGVLPGHVTDHVFDADSLLVEEGGHQGRWTEDDPRAVAQLLANGIRTAEPDGPGAELWLDVREDTHENGHDAGHEGGSAGDREQSRKDRARTVAELVAEALGRPVQLGMVTGSGVVMVDFPAPGPVQHTVEPSVTPVTGTQETDLADVVPDTAAVAPAHSALSDHTLAVLTGGGKSPGDSA
ncbi:hypothetical protein [Streptomyces sp. MMS24-I29]|uniref:WXG100-like domain-containing protein n=1 Tax=Streptomyces sp. MMS24-I29 TaxID=3351480 RepID=UPI003C7B92FF